MPLKDRRLQWRDFADFETLQKLLDDFALLTGITTVIIDPDGEHITKQTLPHNELCMRLIKGTPLGKQRCDECDLECGAKAASEQTYKVYTCKNGLIDFVAPLMFEDEVLGYLFGGQVLAAEDPLDTEWHAQNAKVLGIDPAVYLEALNKITILPRNRIEAAARMLYHTANFISTLTARWVDEREQAREKQTALTYLQEMAADMITELDLQIVLQKAVERTARLVEADIVTIHTYDPLTGEIRGSAGYGLLDAETFRQRKPGGGKAVRLVSSSADPIIAKNALASELSGPFTARERVHSAAGFPLRVRDQTVGVLFVNYREPHNFEPKEIDTLASFGNLVAVAINAARLYDQARNSTQTVRELGEIGPSLIAVRGLDLLLRKIAESAGPVLEADVIVLYEYQEETEDVKVPPVFWGDVRYPEVLSERGYVRPHRESAVFKMLERTEPFYASNAGEDWGQLIEEWPQEKEVSGSFVHREGIVSSAAVPLIAGGKRVGVLFANYRTRHTFYDEERKTIELMATQAAIAIQNARSFQELRRRVNELSVLNQIGQAISTSVVLETQDILQLVYEQTSGLMDTTNFYIALYDAKEDMVNFGLAIEDDGPAELGRGEWAPRKAGNGLTEYIIRSGQPLLIPENVLERLEQIGVDAIGKEAKSWLGVPMIVEDKVTGVIGMQSYERGRAYDAGHAQVLSTIATQAAIAINNAELFRGLQKRIAELEHLREVTQAVAGVVATKPKEVLERIVEGACKVMGADCAVVYPYDPLRSEFYDVKYVATYGTWCELKLADKPRREGGMGAYVKGAGLVIVEDVADDPKMLQSPFIEREKVQAFVGIRLQVGDEIVGILYIDFRAPHRFTDAELEIVKIFSSQAAIAIHNVRQFEQLRERAQTLTSLHQVGRTLTSALDLEQVLADIARHAMDVLGVDVITLYQYDQEKDRFITPPLVAGKLRDPEAMQTPLIYEDSVPAYIIQQLQGSHFAKDASADAIMAGRILDEDEPPRFVVREGVKSSAALLLRARGETVGVMFVNYRSPREFSKDERAIMEIFASHTAIAILNARLFELKGVELQRKVSELEALMAVDKAISSTLNLDEVLSLILEKALGLTKTKEGCGTIQLVVGPALVIRASRGLAKGKESQRIKIGEGVTGWVAKNRAPARIADVSEDQRYIPVMAEDIVSELAVPLTWRGKVIGVLNLESPELNAYDKDDQRLLEALAEQAVIAIQNAQRYEEAQRARRRFETVVVINGAIGSILDRDKILSILAEELHKTIEVPNSVQVLLHDKATGQLEIHPSSYYVIDAEGEQARTHISFNEGLVGWVASHRELVNVPDVAKDPRYLELISETRSELDVPMLDGDEFTGVLCIESPKPHAFTEDDEKLLLAIADQAVIAIQKAVRYEELQRTKTELEAYREIDKAIVDCVRIAPPGLEAVLDLILEKGLEITKAPYGNIMWHDETRRDLVMMAQKGVSKENVGARQKIGEGVVGLVAETKEPLWVSDVTKSPWSSIYLPFIPGMKSELAVPMLEGDRLVGVLNIEHPEANAFREEDERWLEILARQTVIAIQNVKRYEELHEALRALKEEEEKRLAAQRIAMMGSMAANFTHRMANDVGTIPICVQEIRQKLPAYWPQKELVLHYLVRIERDARHLLDMAERLRKPIEPGRMELVNINLLLSTSLREIKIPENVEVVTEYASGLPMVRTDSLLMVDVFKNIMDNAVEAMEYGGILTVESRAVTNGRKWVEVRVADTGCGIPDHVRERLFDPFYTTKKGRGMGFGLWWCTMFLQKVGGDISLESTEIDKGSVFCIRIPVEEERGR